MSFSVNDRIEHKPGRVNELTGKPDKGTIKLVKRSAPIGRARKNQPPLPPMLLVLFDGEKETRLVPSSFYQKVPA